MQGREGCLHIALDAQIVSVALATLVTGWRPVGSELLPAQCPNWVTLVSDKRSLSTFPTQSTFWALFLCSFTLMLRGYPFYRGGN